MSKTGSWLRGTTIKRGLAPSHGANRSSGISANGVGILGAATQINGSLVQPSSTSTIVYGGGVKDPTGKTSEYWTFEDLAVEKEVAIRRRITKEFNKRREDFVDLRSYNDYLEMVEDITFNLINEIDVPETEARIAVYRAENAALIQLNIQREKMEVQELIEEEERERSEREERMRLIRQEEEEERLEREKERKAIIDGLESAKDGTAARIIAQKRAEAHKRNAARAALVSANSQQRTSRSRPSAINAAPDVPDVPHIPFTDNWYSYDDKFTLKKTYDDTTSAAVLADRDGIMRAGGYRVDEAWERAIRMTIAGLEIPPLQGLVVPDTQLLEPPVDEITMALAS
ncbi:hypothetical protein Clacol_006229 [Clathrus columnatus]|uniref:MAT1 centre domain-containing protein n=1 Tax=Clathrus columnatus TaxID=1419009 RepID=A0AAV5AHN0_9AGAM|nr:hypothetical protein Clacol_006229 [Clathrus columnatus]